MIRATKPNVTFQRGSTTSVDHSITTPSTSPAVSAPNGLPIPPRMTAAKIGSSSSKPKLGLEVGQRPREDPGEAGERAGEDPGVEDHPTGVDPRGLGELEVVGEGAHPLAEQAEAEISPTATRTARPTMTTISSVCPIRRPRNSTLLVS